MAWPQVFGPRSGGHEAFEALTARHPLTPASSEPDGKLLSPRIYAAPGLVDEVKNNSARRQHRPAATRIRA
jgi:hypothetical protein